MTDKTIVDIIISRIIDMYGYLSKEQQRIFDMGELYGKIVFSQKDYDVVYYGTDCIKLMKKEKRDDKE